MSYGLIQIEIAISILLFVGYFAYFIIKYRKTPNFLTSILWGLGAFFIANALFNVIILGASSLIESGAIPGNDVVLLFITTIARVSGTVFSAHFVYKMMKRKGTFVQGETDNVVGFMTGSGVIASPFNNQAYLMLLVQSFMNIVIVRRNPSAEELGPDIDPAALDKVREFFDTVEPFNFIYLAIVGIALALGYVLLFRIVSKYYDNGSKMQSVVLPLAVGILYFFTVQITSVLPVSRLLLAIMVLAVVIATYFLEKKYITQ